MFNKKYILKINKSDILYRFYEKSLIKNDFQYNFVKSFTTIDELYNYLYHKCINYDDIEVQCSDLITCMCTCIKLFDNLKA